jgi:hypothetical protein
VIERACVEDVAFRVIAAQQRPDHATIARFVERHQRALADVFGSVLGLCARAGLIGGALVAIDGTKIHANASRDATFDYERIAREIVEEAIATDRAEDELYGEARGDELPPEISTRQGRQKWLGEAQRALDERRAREQRPIPRSRPKRLKESKRRLDLACPMCILAMTKDCSGPTGRCPRLPDCPRIQANRATPRPRRSLTRRFAVPDGIRLVTVVARSLVAGHVRHPQPSAG